MRPIEVACTFVLLIASSGCERADAQALPPARGSGAPPRAELPVVASAAAARPNASQLIVTGSTYPIEEANVGPKAQGVIVALPVDEGDIVKKGQLLFRLNGSIHSHSAAQAKAGLESAKVARENAERDFQRASELREKGAVAQATLDQAKARRDGAVAAVAQAKAALGAAYQLGADTAVYAPIDGVISERQTNLGEVAPAVVMRIENISTLEVRARLPEHALTQVKPGTPVKLRFQTGTEREVVVERLSPSVDSKTRTFEVVAHLPNENHELKAGMLVQLDFGPSVKSADQPSKEPTESAKPE